jgi:hypothetical protein
LWLAIPVRVGTTFTLDMVPNSIAARSVVTSVAFTRLQALGLVGATVHRLESGGRHCVLNGLTIVGHAVQDLDVQIRDVPQFRMPDGLYAVDGYFGLDFFYANFTAIRFDLRKVRLTLEF